jgi:hypothetical protein
VKTKLSGIARSVHDTCDEVTFDAWVLGVDSVTRKRLGVRLDDLPDLCTRDAYDNGSSIGSFFHEDVVQAFRDDLCDL